MSRRNRLQDNVDRVRERIADAARASGRQPESVRLVAVSKYVDVETTAALFEAGCVDLGENRPQAFWAKADALADLAIRWHFIGPLQRNKLARTMPRVALLHAGDRMSLLEAISDFALAGDREPSDVLLEVNCSGEARKGGFEPHELPALFPRIATLSGLRVRGLMTMAGLEGGPARARRDFERLRTLRDALAADRPPEVELDELSMGMSGDYEAAILEGSTMVRVGSALFEGID